ncbi:MAG: NAD-dependent epimerase/dehydratase family protein [Wenzhouxiangella sp.]
MSELIGLTGATGFIGRCLLSHLLGAGYRVRALVRRPEKIQAQPGLELVAGDLDSGPAIQRLIVNCSAVIHVAGAIAGRNYAEFARVNAVGTGRLVEALERHRPTARLILISSLAAREPQLSDYAASKHAGELLVQSSTLDWIILRPPAVYGPDDPALAPLWRMLARGWLLRAGPAQARFSLLHVDDLCAALLALLERAGLGGQVHCLDDGQVGAYRWSDIAELGSRISGRRVRTLAIPRAALKTAALVNLHSSCLRAAPPILVPGKVRELIHTDWVCDNTLSEIMPHWTPQRRLENALHELPGWRK